MLTIYQKNLTHHMDVHIVTRLAKQCIFYQCHAQITSRLP